MLKKLSIALCFCLTFSSRVVRRDEPTRFHTGSLERPEGQPAPFASHFGTVDQLYKNMFHSFRHLSNFLGDGDDDSGFSGFLNRAQPWWKGPNVCITQEATQEEDPNGMMSVFSLTSHMCSTYNERHTCVAKVGSNGKVNVTTVTYRCCHGYERVPGELGCTQELDLKPLGMAIREMNLTDFADILERLEGDMLSRGNFTIFVPTNEAMEAGQDFPDVVSGGTTKDEYVRNILEAHMVEGWIPADRLRNEQVLTSLSEEPIRINAYFTGAKPTANCAPIRSVNHKATNGIIHVVDKVLFPVEMTLAEILKLDNSLSQFASLLSPEEHEELKNESKHFTLFAFTNDGFDALPEDTRKSIQQKDSCFGGLTKHHTLNFTLCSSAVQGANFAENWAGVNLNLTRAEDILHVDGAVVKVADRVAKNGVIHVIDRVLLSEGMLSPLRIAERRGGEDLAKEIQGSAAAMQKIKEAAEITVFIPMFTSIQTALENKEPAEREKVVMAHVVEGKTLITPSDMSADLKTLAGPTVSLSVEARPTLMATVVTATVQCSRIVRANIEGCNGVVHYVDKPIQVPVDNVFDAIKKNPKYSYFAGLLELSEFDDVLRSAEFDGSVLVPNNEVFEAYGKSRVDSLAPDALKQFVGGHILMRAHCCASISGSYLYREQHRTRADHHVFSFNVGFSKHFGDATVIKCDQLGTNGIVHEVDAVLDVPRQRLQRWW